MADKAKISDVSPKGVPTRGSVIEGVVVSDKMNKTVTVRADYIIKVPKYDRMKRRHTKIKARNPPEIDAKIGDFVKIAECRPLSKTVHFIVIEKKEAPKTVSSPIVKKLEGSTKK
jgi:small subunit ribosomal protein S17